MFIYTYTTITAALASLDAINQKISTTYPNKTTNVWDSCNKWLLPKTRQKSMPPRTAACMRFIFPFCSIYTYNTYICMFMKELTDEQTVPLKNRVAK